MGGFNCPKIKIRLEAEISQGDLVVIANRLIVPDIVNGILASDLASVPIRNEMEVIIEILGIECIDVRTSPCQRSEIGSFMALRSKHSILSWWVRLPSDCYRVKAGR